MRKLSYEEKPRLTLRKVAEGYTLTYIGPSLRVWRGCGATPMLAWRSLEWVLKEYHVNLQMQENRRTFLTEGLKNGPDIGLGPSDYHVATSNLPWWRRIFRI